MKPQRILLYIPHDFSKENGELGSESFEPGLVMSRSNPRV